MVARWVILPAQTPSQPMVFQRESYSDRLRHTGLTQRRCSHSDCWLRVVRFSTNIYEDVLHLIGLGAILGRIADSFPGEDENRLFYTLGTKIVEHAKAIEGRLSTVEKSQSAAAA
ncbi:hypothetical protein [Bradyrhizobium sp. DASA03120]|uniref:hypothetical protein n=1 Tax=Bradyrhizobium sp. SMVTL-02 TaxID=3395917 RepID=UPI003F72D73B